MESENVTNSESLDDAKAMLRLASEAYEKGNFGLVEQLCDKGLATGEEGAEFLYLLGCAQFEIGRPQIGLKALARALEKDPAHQNALYMTAGIYYDQGDYPQAIHYTERLIQLNSTLYLAFHLKGMALFESQEFWASLEAFRRAYELANDSPNVIASLGNNLRVVGHSEDALTMLEDGIKRFPEHLPMMRNLANVYMEYGRNREAEAMYKAVLSRDPLQPAVYTNLADCRRWTADDAEGFQWFESRLDDNTPKEIARDIHFALGKMYNDIKEYDKAFFHYQEANTLRYAIFDIREKHGWLENLKDTFDRELIEGYHSPGEDDGRDLVFIVGFPRSGSTLLERVLGASDQIEGVGEAAALHLALSRRLPTRGESFRFPADFSDNIDEHIPSLVEAYRKYIPTIGEDAPILVDKTLFNFELLGLLYLMFPKAKFIHTIRHPLDSCLSSYFQSFLAGLYWSYSLKNTGQYYRFYREVMDYWRSVLPMDILDVRYEDLVTHPQQESRRIYEYLGVEWTPAVLESHRNDAPVRTASKQQVREKISTQSVERWHGYAGYLRPLANELREFLSEEDLRVLDEHGVVIGEARTRAGESARSEEKPQGWAGRLFARLAGGGRKV